MPDETIENGHNDVDTPEEPTQETQNKTQDEGTSDNAPNSDGEATAEPIEDAELEEKVETIDPMQAMQIALDNERARADENYELALRTKADMDNLRKRTTADVDKARKFALEKFATEIITVRDSLEMGIDAANKENADIQSIREGTDLTLKMLSSAMSKFSVEQVDPIDQPFDPELHQAVGMQESPDHEANTVMVVMQKGYTLNGRLLRPAMVMVSK